MVHEVALRGFGCEAEAYERSPPSYPPDAVAWLVDHLRVRPGAVVADLAAGTGKFTRLLVPTGASVLAIEPVEGMRQVLHEALPRVRIVAGTAEAMPVKSSSLHAVCAAQGLPLVRCRAGLRRAGQGAAAGGTGGIRLERPRPRRRLGAAPLGHHGRRGAGGSLA